MDLSKFGATMHAVIYALAVSRLSRLLTDDYITAPLRTKMKESGNRHLAYLQGCPACSSIWAAALALIIPKKILVVLAASEVTVLLRVVEDALAGGSDDDDDDDDDTSAWRSD
jgi:hypothetical protein